MGESTLPDAGAIFFGALPNIRLKYAALALSHGRRAALSAAAAAGA